MPSSPPPRTRFAGALPPPASAANAGALLLLDTVDFPVAFWGALRAGVVPVPINTLLTPNGRLHPGGQPGGGGRISAPLVAPLLPVLHSLPATAPDHRPLPDGSAPACGPARGPVIGPGRGFLAVALATDAGDPDRQPCRLAGRGGVLALFLRLDRRAERRAARPCQPARDRRYLRRAGAAESGRTT